jgi:hypothetical protein
MIIIHNRYLIAINILINYLIYHNKYKIINFVKIST